MVEIKISLVTIMGICSLFDTDTSNVDLYCIAYQLTEIDKFNYDLHSNI